MFPQATPGYTGQAIVSWTDSRSVDQDIYAGYLDLRGPVTAVRPRSLGVPGSSISLAQPNPFGLGTSFQVTLAAGASQARVEIVDAAGRVVRVLSGGHAGPATWEERWDGRNQLGEVVSTGVYFARLAAGSRTLAVRKITLLR